MTAAAVAPDDADAGPQRRVLVLAPRGRDAEIVQQVLGAQGFDCTACASLAHLLDELRAGAGLGLITEEALAGADLAPVFAWIAEQPPWSDFPLIVLASRHAGRRSDEATATLRDLINVVLLERPLNAQTLVSAARSALRSRVRQYEARRYLVEQLRISQENERLLEAERLARADAEHASRSKDQFLATLSHELRTPLGAILGWVAILRRRAADPADLKRGLDTIERNARTQSKLIDELLDMSRIIAGSVVLERESVMPWTVLEAVLGSLQPAIDAKGLRVAREGDDTVGPVSADPHRLQQIVWNLVMNAVKFTPDGGTLTLALRTDGDRVELTVRDSGVGIAADFLPYVFDRFRQADGSSTRRHGGLGLGLSIVRQLAELHGGSVQAHSGGLGQGATFALRLPLSVEAGPAVASADGPGAPGDAPAAESDDPHLLRGVHVLLVDDDTDGREVAARVLGEAGAAVDDAGSAARALELLDSEPGLQVLVSDVAMPEVDGYALLREARRRGHRLPAIALTAFARPEDRQEALDRGFVQHLSKPIEPMRLLQAVRQAAGQPIATSGRRAPMSPSASDR